MPLASEFHSCSSEARPSQVVICSTCMIPFARFGRRSDRQLDLQTECPAIAPRPDIAAIRKLCRNRGRKQLTIFGATARQNGCDTCAARLLRCVATSRCQNATTFALPVGCCYDWRLVEKGLKQRVSWRGRVG